MFEKMAETFTINMLKTFKECPKKYEYVYIQKLRLPEDSKKTLTGNKLHSLINFYLKKQDISKLLPLLDDKEKVLWDSFKKLCPDNVIESEYSFNLKFKDIWLTGRIDAIFKDDNKYLIADWKTSGYIRNDGNEKEQLQTAFYLYSLFNIYKEKGLINNFDELSMKYFVLSSGEVLEVTLTEALCNGYEQEIDRLLAKIQSEKTFLKTENDCKYCQYREMCF